MSSLPQERLISLDVFRGLTIAVMVLVNNPGTWAHIYDPLEHAAWHGMTPTDWIFPFFLFMVGVSIPIALGKEGISRSGSYRKIATRAISIFALGLSISVLPFFQFTSTDAPDLIKMLVWLAFAAALFFLLLRNYRWAGILATAGLVGIAGMNIAGYNVVPYNVGTMRIFGVLQRIAVCYLVVSILFLHTTWRQQLYIAIGILVGYWVLMTAIPVPGCDITTIDDKACNLAAYIDRVILSENHIWRAGRVYDPEGILSTLPAIATTISGVLTGTWLRSNADRTEKAGGMFFFGTAFLGLGWIWNSYFPFNKSLWTSSYVFATTGLALLTLAACYWLIDIRGYRKWTKPFVIFGVNALPLFVFSGIMARMLSAFRVTGTDGQIISVQKWIFDNIYLAIAQPIDASLLYAISFIMFWLFLMWLLYRARIFIRV